MKQQTLFLTRVSVCSDFICNIEYLIFNSAIVVVVSQHNRQGEGVCPLLVFVNPKSGGMKGRELLYSFRKLLNPHQVFDISNGGPLAG